MDDSDKYRLFKAWGILQGLFGAIIFSISISSMEDGHTAGVVLFMVGFTMVVGVALPFQWAEDLRVKWTKDLYKPKDGNKEKPV